jgi:conjugative transfer signal peptidase TraF
MKKAITGDTQVMGNNGSPNRWDRVCWGVLGVGAALCVVPVLVATCTPFLWVTTHSLPWGIYRRTHEPIRRGMLVHFCLPEALASYALERGYVSGGLCPGLTQELVKPVAALAGDEVEISAQGVAVNGSVIPDTPVYVTDSQGRPHAVSLAGGSAHVIIPQGYVFVLSNFHPRSWDSRYFGPLPLTAIRGTVREVWTW